jgi:hypothetical protein
LHFAALFDTISAMFETGKKELAIKKAYEIAYALWRITANTPVPLFGRKLKGKAVDIIDFAAEGKWNRLLEKLPGMEMLVQFGSDVGAISLANQEILIKEIGNLKSAIADIIENQPKNNNVEIADIFSEDSVSSSEFEMAEELPENEPETKIENLEEIEIMQPGEDSKDNEGYEDDKSAIQAAGGSGKAEIRQAAIIERIRQTGNCRLSDIQIILPDCSERTIRYDLEALVQQNRIERIGIGGRGVYYKLASS